ncbi:MAG: hotdog family protein [Phycisphaerales bacterium]
MRWIWIDRITALEKGRRCAAVKNVSLAEEHLHDHFCAVGTRKAVPIMPAPLIIEGMAQTAGILVGHARDFQEKVILAKITKATFERDVFPGQTLIYEATLDRIDAAGAATTGTVHVIDYTTSGGGEAVRQFVGTIELMFSHIDQNMKGLAFPEHNFVFTDQFMDLLRNSGF